MSKLEKDRRMLLEALKDIVSSSEADCHGSLMNAIQHAKELINQLEGR